MFRWWRQFVAMPDGQRARLVFRICAVVILITLYALGGFSLYLREHFLQPEAAASPGTPVVIQVTATPMPETPAEQAPVAARTVLPPATPTGAPTLFPTMTPVPPEVVATQAASSPTQPPTAPATPTDTASPLPSETPFPSPTAAPSETPTSAPPTATLTVAPTEQLPPTETPGPLGPPPTRTGR